MIEAIFFCVRIGSDLKTLMDEKLKNETLENSTFKSLKFCKDELTVSCARTKVV